MKRENNDCLSRCVAVYFRMNHKKVPFFVNYKDWAHRLQRFFRRRGYYFEPTKFNPKLLENPKRLYFIHGLSWATKKTKIYHMVLYLGKKKFYDPARSNRFLKGRPRWVYVIKKLDKKIKREVKLSQRLGRVL